MNVRCPQCDTVYRVDPRKVPEGGIRARCASCAGVILVRRAMPGIGAPPARTGPPSAAPPEEVRQTARARPAVAHPPQPPALEPPPEAEVAVAAEPQKRPVAPVFRPTPGRPVVAPPVPPRRPPAPEPAAPEGPAATAQARPAAAPAETRPARPVHPFLARDPAQRARRLARALVSDMIVYQPEKRQRALAAGNLKAAFAEEIKKSWEEYVEQVGEELANSTTYFRDALNEILAGGQKLF